MLTRLTHITLFVKDQQEALDFYINKLGFKLHTDAPFGDMRWVTICPSQQPEMEIALMQAVTPEQEALVGKQGGGVPLFSFATNDCRATYQELKDRGVECIQAPEEQPWGVSAACVDLYGNTLYLCQSVIQ
jgi:predicted enzyme related to lactoylglutathione lyase